MTKKQLIELAKPLGITHVRQQSREYIIRALKNDDQGVPVIHQTADGKPAAAKTYRCALFSPNFGQCTRGMYHVETEHRFDPSSPWTETLEELQAFYALREKHENARDEHVDEDR
jgi:hypothetical protein